jgi:hypothetical protein
MFTARAEGSQSDGFIDVLSGAAAGWLLGGGFHRAELGFSRAHRAASRPYDISSSPARLQYPAG